MNNFNLISKQKSQSDNAAPSLIEIPSPNGQKNSILTLNKNGDSAKPSVKEAASTISLGRKKPNQQTPAEIVSEVAEKKINQNNSNVYVQCQFLLQDESCTCLEAPVSKQINLTPDELEEFLAFAEEIEQRRRKQEKEQQEKRSWAIAKKICAQPGGTQFFSEHSIACLSNSEGCEEWCQNLTVIKPDGNAEEISQPLNFYNPQHSWLLENWLSQQAVAWTVKRYCPNPEQVLYQVSFGFPDQTFLEAEGPSREGSILAVAEDLLEE